LERQKHEDLIHQIMQMRETFHRQYRDEVTNIVEFYDPERYLHCSSLADNLMFGESPEAFSPLEKLLENHQTIDFLEHARLLEPLLRWGIRLTETTLQLYDNRTSEGKVFDTPELISPDDVDGYKQILYNVKKKQGKPLKGRARREILRATLNYVPNRHKHIKFPNELAERTVAARPKVREKMCEVSPDEIKSCSLSDYLYSQSILTNILFGKFKGDSPTARDRLNTVVNRLLVERNALEKIVEMGLQHQVGDKGANLSGGQQQKLAIARVLIKNPPILIMDEATSGLDNASQARIQQLLEDRWRGQSTLLAVVHRLDIIKNYDKIAVMKDGKLLESGTYHALMDKQGVFYELVNKRR
jgi:ABC-type phosphate/phosphonate transport system ATPase subunit